MKKIIVSIIMLVILSFSVTALLGVELVYPKIEIEKQPDNVVFFKCNVTEADNIRLFTNITGIWTQAGFYDLPSHPYTGFFEMPYYDVPQGTFIWNCKVNNVLFASSNATFTLVYPKNIPPVFNGTIPEKSWNKDQSLNNAVDLKNYFTDPDSNPQPLQFSVVGNSNIVVTFSAGMVGFSQPPGWFGVETVYFQATDSQDTAQSNPVKLTVVNVGGGSTTNNTANTTTNTKPKISGITDQVKEVNVDFWTLDLDNFIEDSEDPDEDLNVSVENVDTKIVEITINEISHKVTFVPVGVGENVVTFVVTDTKGLTGEQDVIINIIGESNMEGEVMELKIESHTPGSSDPKGTIGEPVPFFIVLNAEEANVIWYVDGVEVKSGKGLDNFEFIPDIVGDFKVSVTAEKDGASDDYEWKLIVEEANTSAELGLGNLCGNGAADVNETCKTCPEDSPCKEGEECTDNGCVTKQKITGLSIANIRGFGIVGGVAAGIIVIVILAVFVRAKNKHAKHTSGDKKLTAFYGKQEMGSKKPEVIEVKNIVSEEKKDTTAGIEPIIGFIQAGLASGDTEKTIKKALLKSGWKRRDVKHAFASVKK